MMEATMQKQLKAMKVMQKKALKKSKYPNIKRIKHTGGKKSKYETWGTICLKAYGNMWVQPDTVAIMHQKRNDTKYF